MSDGVEQVDGAGGVGVEGGQGVFVAGDDEGLGGQVEDDLGLMGGDEGAERGRVLHIPSFIFNLLPYPRQGKHTGGSGWFQAKAYHPCPQHVQPVGQPGTFKSRVPGDENSFASVDLSEGAVHINSWELRGTFATRKATDHKGPK